MLFTKLLLIVWMATFCIGAVSASTCGITMDVGFDYNGYDLQSGTTSYSFISSVISPAACCSLCVVRVDCYFWTWANDLSQGGCYLKYSSAGNISSVMHTSGNVSPIPCKAGWYSNSGAPPCTACPAGTYAPGISILSAVYALASNSFQSIDCTVKMSAHVLANRLAFQPYGTGNDAMSLTGICGDPYPGQSKVLLLNLADLPFIFISDTATQVVDVTPSSIVACTICMAGLFGSTSGLSGSACSGQCAAGYFCTAGSTSDTQNICPLGAYCPPGSAAPILCPTGTYGPIQGQSSALSQCMPCAQGLYGSTEGLSMCGGCGSGSFSNITGATTCIPCAAGYFQNNTSQTSCLLCAAGTFNALSAAITCNQCPPGSISGVGQAACSQCAVASYASSNTCVACPLGTYATSTFGGGVSLALACQTCPIGSTSFVNGATSVMQCIDIQPPTLVSQVPLVGNTNVSYNLSSLVLVFSEAVTLGQGIGSFLAVDQLSSTGVVVTRIFSLYFTPAMETTMVRSNGNRTLTVALPVALFKLETRYAVSISLTLIYDFSPLSNAFVGLTHGEWWFITQPGPIITNSTLKLDSNPGLGSKTLVVSSTKAGTVIQFHGVRLMDFGVPTVTYGPYGCSVLPGSNSTTLRCTVAAGVGFNFVFVLTLAAVPSFSVTGTDILSYPPPSIASGSLRRNNVNFTGMPPMTSSASEVIEFDGLNFGSDITRILLAYGPIGVMPPPFVCTVLTVSDNTVRFSTASAGEGTHLVFRIVVGGQAANGTDSYQYPTVPHVSAVYSDGCQVAGNSIYNCATQGGVTLNITGLQLNAPLVITVAQAGCSNVVYDANGNWVTCRMGTGTGFNQSIVVAQNALYSVPVFFVSFAAPVITQITGCATMLNKRAAGCVRAGGGKITVVGTNFGVDSASVFVAGHECLAVQHDALTPHSRLTCVLPSGYGLNREVLMLQHRGEISLASNAAYISYDPCLPGTFVSDILCVACGQGAFTMVQNADGCIDCDAGTFSNVTGLSACAKCLPGTYSLKSAVNCTRCAVGQYTDAFAQSSCKPAPIGSMVSETGLAFATDCQPGYFQNIAGNNTCIPCVAGTYVGTSGSASCLPCSAGTQQKLPGQTSCVACPAGWVSQYDPALNGLVGPTGCKACSVGEYMPTANQAVCISCDAGYFSNVTGTVFCQACQPGSYSGKGVTTCQMCKVGNYAGFPGQSMCKPCPAGSVAKTSGAIACFACEPGTAVSMMNTPQAFCQSCSPGTFSVSPSSLQCDNCAANTYAPIAHASTCFACPTSSTAPIASTDCTCAAGFLRTNGMCTACPVGSFYQAGSSMLNATCVLCAAGSISSSPGSLVCTPCDVNMFAGQPGTSVCRICIAHASSPINSAECVCDPGYLRNDTTGLCTVCPVGSFYKLGTNANNATCGLCAAGSISNSIGSLFCTQCDVNTFARLPGSSVCQKCTTHASSSINAAECICDQVAGFYLDSETLTCLVCPDGADCLTSGRRTELTLYSLAGWWRDVTALKPSFYNCPLSVNACPSSANGACNTGYGGVMCTLCKLGFHLTSNSCTGCTISSKSMLFVIPVVVLVVVAIFYYLTQHYDLEKSVMVFKICTGFAQVMGSSNRTYNIPWPSYLDSVMTQMRIFMLDVFQITSVDCWQYVSFYTAYLVAVLSLIAFVLLAWAMHTFMDQILLWLPSYASSAKAFRNTIVKFTTLVIGIVYPAISVRALSLWNCQLVGDHYFLVADYSLMCSGTPYLLYSIFNALFVVAFVIGWPVFLIVYLLRIKDRLNQETVIARIGHVYKSYVDRYYYWDVVETLRKLYLTALVSFFTSGSMVQIVLSLVVSVLACIQQAHYRPFKHQWVNWLQQSSLMIIWATLQSGMLMQYRGDIGDNSKVALGVILFAANVIMVMGPIVIIGLVAIRALPKTLVQRYFVDDALHIDTSAAATTVGDVTEKIGERSDDCRLRDPTIAFSESGRDQGKSMSDFVMAVEMTNVKQNAVTPVLGH